MEIRFESQVSFHMKMLNKGVCNLHRGWLVAVCNIFKGVTLIRVPHSSVLHLSKWVYDSHKLLVGLRLRPKFLFDKRSHKKLDLNRHSSWSEAAVGSPYDVSAGRGKCYSLWNLEK